MADETKKVQPQPEEFTNVTPLDTTGTPTSTTATAPSGTPEEFQKVTTLPTVPPAANQPPPKESWGPRAVEAAGSMVPQGFPKAVQESQEAVGSVIPQWALPVMGGFQKYVNEPLNRAASWGAQKGGAYAKQKMAEEVTGGSTINPSLTDEQRMAQATKEHPYMVGTAGAVGEVAGGLVTDPRNWPFLGAGQIRPLLQKALSGGFGVAMTKDTADMLTDTAANWDQLTPEQRANALTKAGISGAMAATTTSHAVKGTDIHPYRTAKEIVQRIPEIVKGEEGADIGHRVGGNGKTVTGPAQFSPENLPKQYGVRTPIEETPKAREPYREETPRGPEPGLMTSGETEATPRPYAAKPFSAVEPGEYREATPAAPEANLITGPSQYEIQARGAERAPEAKSTGYRQAYSEPTEFTPEITKEKVDQVRAEKAENRAGDRRVSTEPFEGEERRQAERRQSLMTPADIEPALKEGKPVRTPFDVTEGAKETMARDTGMPKSPAEQAQSRTDLSKTVSEYNKSVGRPEVKDEKVETDPRVEKIADEYEKMQHNPSDPQVKKSYDSLIKETKDQWDALKKAGYTMEVSDKDPYSGYEDMAKDVQDNKRIKVWSGGEPPADHPLSGIDPETGLSYNTMFRAVHDIMGHVAGENDFSQRGEENAYQRHAQSYSKEALPALTTETKGQTSSFFNSPKVRAGAQPEFAAQKAAILPEEFHGKQPMAPENVLKHIEGGKDYAVVTAENPDNTRISDEENAKRNSELKAELLKRGYTPVEVEGHTKDVEGNKEHSFFVPDIDPKDAAEIGRKFGQQAVLTTEGLHDLKTDKVNPTKTGQKLMVDDEAKKQPYYSTTVVGNKAFSVPIDFEKEITPAANNASGESAASQEAINREKSQKEQGVKTYRVDTRSGKVTPVSGVDAVDAKANTGEKIIQVKGDQITEMDSGTGAHTLDEKKVLDSIGQQAATEIEAGSKAYGTVERHVADLTNSNLKELGKAVGLDPAKYDFKKRTRMREGGSTHPVERTQMVKDIMSKLTPEQVDRIGDASEKSDTEVVGGEPARSAKSRSEIAEKLLSDLWNGKNQFEGKGPAPEATWETAKMSEEELLKHGFTKEDIDAGKYIPGVGGGGPEPVKKMAGMEKVPEKITSKFLTEEEQGLKTEQSQKSAAKKLLAMPKLQEFVDIANLGAGERKWYQRGTEAVKAIAGELPEYFDKPEDQGKFLNVLASLSPRQEITENFTEALRAWKELKGAEKAGVDLNGELKTKPPKGFPKEEKWTVAGKILWDNIGMNRSAKIPNALRAMEGKSALEMWPDLSKNRYFKVPSFAANLSGFLNKVTSDGWMAAFAGMTPGELSNASSYHPLAVMTRAAADELGWEPAEAQAAIWAAVKTLTEKGETEPAQIRKYSKDFADIAQSDVQIRDMLKDMGVDMEKLDARLKAIAGKPEVSSRTTPTTEDSTRKLVNRLGKQGREIPEPKSKYEAGSLNFGEEDTSFNPEEFGKKKPKYGSAK